jgi:hypothetical protein
MTALLESDLRAALRERGALVPATSVSRLVAHDYHPRTRRLTPPVAVGAAAGAAGTAGAVAAVISLSAGASNAFAGWTPTPTVPGPEQLAAAIADCKSQSPIAGLPLKLTDTRGPFTFFVYADSRASATCITGPSFTSVAGSMSAAPVDVPAGHLQLFTDHRTDRGGQAYSFAEGRTGSGVTAVKLMLDDGSAVDATVQNGWFVAWWPSAHEVKTADITDPSGVTTQKFDLNHESPCGAKLCTGGAIGKGVAGPVTAPAGSASGSTPAGQGGGVQGFSVSR